MWNQSIERENNFMKYIIFGGFDYAVRYEMDQDAIFHGIDYFVDNDPALIGTTYLGKEIKNPDALLSENKDDILIMIGSIVYRTELTFQLKDMGFEEEKHFIWGIAFCGDEKCPRLWKHIEWKDRVGNSENLDTIAQGEFSLARLRLAARMINFDFFKTIVDLGAANERLRDFLPVDITYIPVDYIRYSNQTVLCDLNQYEFPLDGYNPETTCILSMGNVGYCENWKWYLDNVAKSCSCFIYGQMDFARITREWRRNHWTRYNALFNHEIIIYMQKSGFRLTDAVDFRLKTTIYKFEKID